MSGNIFNRQGFGIPTIIKDGEDFLSLTAMCGDCGYKAKDCIRAFLSNEDNLRFIITRQIIEDPGYLQQNNDETNVRGGQMSAPNYDSVVRYVNTIIDRIKHENGRWASAELLINEYGLTCLHIKKGGRSSGQGIYAHHDIALHFATWLNPAYGVFVNEDYQRLKHNELDKMGKKSINWIYDRRDAALWHRTLETVARSVIVPKRLDLPIEDELMIPEDDLQLMRDSIVAGTMIYISNLINVTVFGKTAQQWKSENPDKEGNMRDYATEDELTLVGYLEYRMIKVITEEPSNRWDKIIKSIAKKCRETGKYTVLKLLNVQDIITNNDPVSYESRTMTSLEAMRERFLRELSEGEVHQCEDKYFRNNEGFIVLAPKF